MEQRDYLMREIEKIGQMLLGILGKLRRRQEEVEYDYGLTLAEAEFKAETGFTLEEVVALDAKGLNRFFDQQPGLNSINLELLADLLIEVGDQRHHDGKRYLCQALRILRMIDQRERTFSLERAVKEDQLSRQVGENKPESGKS